MGFAREGADRIIFPGRRWRLVDTTDVDAFDNPIPNLVLKQFLE